VLQTLPQIKETYIDSGQVYYVFKDLPLAFHPNAQKAAEAARCAGAQGAYLPMHEQLFEYQSQWTGQNAAAALDTFVAYAGELDLDTETFRTCVKSGQFAAQIAQDMAEAQQAGISGTPSFLINGQVLVGAYPFEDFQKIIEAALQK
jgi:protein-disulfide isomerase